jgi:iron complex transport system ATP-binding protein
MMKEDVRVRHEHDSEPILELNDLNLRRGEAGILNGIDWRVEQGEHWVIMGPNGCGKTSLLKVITGYMTASSGELSLLGHRYGKCDWRELRLKIGIVSSALQASIPAAETALDTVISGRYAQLDLWVKPREEDRKRARHLLRFFGAGALEKRPWLYLSQGERQRILLARALMASPRLLILDEPCSGLDPVARESFLAYIQRLALHRRAPALILVTHHVEEIMPCFTHLLLLRKGKTLGHGALRTVLTPENLGRAFGKTLRLRRRAVPGGHRFNPVWM